MRNQRRHDSSLSIAALKLVGSAAALSASVVALLNLPDLVRYLRMRRM